uniref:transcriptional repressor p66-alpha-like n=1 Tax=Myxine glutinosa TaxID=7769 RepID=UPI00358E9B0E
MEGVEDVRGEKRLRAEDGAETTLDCASNSKRTRLSGDDSELDGPEAVMEEDGKTSITDPLQPVKTTETEEDVERNRVDTDATDKSDVKDPTLEVEGEEHENLEDTEKLCKEEMEEEREIRVPPVSKDSCSVEQVLERESVENSAGKLNESEKKTENAQADDSEFEKMNVTNSVSSSAEVSEKDVFVTGTLAAGERSWVDGRPASSSSSDKENSCEEPVDMSTAKPGESQKCPGSPDVIVLSDDGCSPTANGLPKADTTRLLKVGCPAERGRLIRRLQEELRLEEAKLVLLKKLRQSQLHKHHVKSRWSGPSEEKLHGKPAVSVPPNSATHTLSRGGTHGHTVGTQAHQSRSLSGPAPPPLLRGGQPYQGISRFSQQGAGVLPLLVRGGQAQGSRSSCVPTAPPPLLMAPRTTVVNQAQGGRTISGSGMVRNTSVTHSSTPSSCSYNQVSRPTASPSPSPRSESPALRQAAARLALRKQLEKTLLEIAPPRPPPPDLPFLPCAVNGEFVCLLGLEEVVQLLLESQASLSFHPLSLSLSPSLGKAGACLPEVEPYACSHCGTDYTVGWRRRPRGDVVCQACLASGVKASLRAEHTGRLKAAFMKALQQEQEIEKQIQNQSQLPGSVNKQNRPQVLPTKQHIVRRGVMQLSGRPQPPLRASVMHNFGSHHQLQSSGKLLGMSGGVGLSYVGPGLTSQKSAAERQREYLLDMLPSRTGPQSSGRAHVASRAPVAHRNAVQQHNRRPLHHSPVTVAGRMPSQLARPAIQARPGMGHFRPGSIQGRPGLVQNRPTGSGSVRPSVGPSTHARLGSGVGSAQGGKPAGVSRSMTQPTASWK